MEMHMNLNIAIGNKVPSLHSPNLNHQKSTHYAKTITCKVKKISMQEEKTNFYKLLSLSSEKVGFEDIKRAYRSMALRFHPDVCSSSTKEESTMQFIELRKAYDTLSDPNLRKIYDNELGLVSNVERREGFNRNVWERQLNGLTKRSFDGKERKKNGVM